MIGQNAKKHIELTVEGMNCSHCEETVRNTLIAVDGVAKVLKVDKDKNLAEIKVDDPANVPTDAMISALSEAGYSSSLA
jgi:copper chaperone